MGAPQRLYLMLNKPRGVVTTAQDERGRDTVYRCFDGAGLPWIAPVGRLDKASEGLLLFSNDPQWAAHLTDPETGPQKTYHVQVDRLPDEDTLAALRRCRRRGRAPRRLCRARTAQWRQDRMAGGGPRRGPQPPYPPPVGGLRPQVLRLVRVAIGGLLLGDLGKGQWRVLQVSDQQRLGAAAPG